MEETSKHSVWWTANLFIRKDSISIKHHRTQSFTTRHQLDVSRRLWEVKKFLTIKYLRNRGFLRRFLLYTIGGKKCVQKLLKVVKTPNNPNQKVKIELLEQGHLIYQSINEVRVFWKSKMFSAWLRKQQWANRLLVFQLCASVCWTLTKTKTQTKTLTRIMLKRRDPFKVNNQSCFATRSCETGK